MMTWCVSPVHIVGRVPMRLSRACAEGLVLLHIACVCVSVTVVVIHVTKPAMEFHESRAL